MTTTTIRVEETTRDVLIRHAKSLGLTADQMIQILLIRWEFRPPEI